MLNYVICIATVNRNILNNSALLNSGAPLLIINQCSAKNGELTKTDFKHFKSGDIQFYNFNEFGISKSRNRAFEHADASWLIIADDDLQYDIDCLNDLIANAKNHDIIIFSNKDCSGPKFNGSENNLRLVFSAASVLCK